MPIDLSAADRAGMTAEEISALTGADADTNLAAHGGGDGDQAAASARARAEEAATAAAAEAAEAGTTPPVTPPADDATKPPPAEGAAAPEAGEGEGEGAPTLDELASLLEEDASTTAPFKVEGPADYKAERATLRAEKDAIETKWGAGELTDAERVVELGKVDDKLEDLLVSHTRAETLRTANQQTAEQAMTNACKAVAAASKAVDYAKDSKAGAQFDGFLSMLAGDPDNAKMSAVQLAQAAHRSVLAIRGLTETAAAPPPPPPAAPAAPGRRDVPTATLSGVPAASPTGMESEALSKFNTLEGEDAEDYLASLPAAEQARILRASDVTAMQHTGDSRSKRAHSMGKDDRKTEDARALTDG